MAAGDTILHKGIGTLVLAARGGGTFNTSDGTLLSGAESVTLDFDGEFQMTPPALTKQQVFDRGVPRKRSSGGPVMIHNGYQAGSMSIQAALKETTDASAAKLADLGLWLMSEGRSGDYVSDNWESVFLSSQGGNDTCVPGVAFRMTWTSCSNGSDTHYIGANYCTGTIAIADGDPTQITIALEIQDHPDDIFVGP